MIWTTRCLISLSGFRPHCCLTLWMNVSHQELTMVSMSLRFSNDLQLTERHEGIIEAGGIPINCSSASFKRAVMSKIKLILFSS
ncbi:hypothetical protein Y032_0074g864 [Ancylostoma ceylanicum]|nr:hypothetical protein Y032_0074g864 [Ancylostoma ceylanicum]